MSVTVMAEVWRLNLPTTDKLVLLALADHAHDDGTKCYPGVARLSHKTGCSRRTVQRALSALRKTGVLEVAAFAAGGRGKATEYRIHTAKGDTVTPFSPQQRVTPATERVTPMTQRVTPVTAKGDTVTPQPSVTTLNHPTTAVKPRDPLWDTMIEVMAPVEPLTKGERGRWNTAIRDIREADGTPEQLRAVAQHYRRRWPDIEFTPTGISNNWSHLLTGKPPSSVGQFLDDIQEIRDAATPTKT